MSYRIAFIRYKNSQEYVKDTYPDDLIIQFQLYTNQTSPWECLIEDEFSNEFAKNITLIQNFINSRVEMLTSIEVSKLEIQKQNMADDSEEFKLYLQFLDWKDKMADEQVELKAQEIKRLENLRQGIVDNGEIKFTHPLMERMNQFKHTRMRVR